MRVGGVSERTLAAPSQIVASMIRTWPDLMAAAAVTTVEAVAGFLIAVAAGVIIGIGLHLSKTLDRAVSPLLVAAQTIPLITIAPLFVIWFGFEPFGKIVLVAVLGVFPLITIAPLFVIWFGFEPFGKIVLVAVLGVFPIAVQTTRGLDAVPRFYEDVALTCGATRSWTLWHVKAAVLRGRGTDLRGHPLLDALARQAARGRAPDLRRHPHLRRLRVRHGRHRRIPRRRRWPGHLAAGRIQLVPDARR